MQFFDVIFDEVTFLMLPHRKKEVPREDLKGFGDDFGRLLGEAQMHFRLEISSIENCCSMELILNFKCVMSCVSKKIHALIFLVLGFFGGVFFDF